MKEGERAVGV